MSENFKAAMSKNGFSDVRKIEAESDKGKVWEALSKHCKYNETCRRKGFVSQNLVAKRDEKKRLAFRNTSD